MLGRDPLAGKEAGLDQHTSNPVELSREVSQQRWPIVADSGFRGNFTEPLFMLLNSCIQYSHIFSLLTPECCAFVSLVSCTPKRDPES